MAGPIVFKPAVRFAVKLKAAIDGPSGSGKTEGALEIATALVKEYGGKIALADTEALGEQGGAASLYADRYHFDTVLVPDAHPAIIEDVIDAAVAGGYQVLVIDTLSHVWQHQLDAKDDHERANPRDNKWTLWRIYGPEWERVIKKITRSDIHVIATMRSKQEYKQVGSGSEAKIEKLGLQPQVREGSEYEFSLVFSVNMQHATIVTKGRAVPWVVGSEILNLRQEKVKRQLIDWMNVGGTANPAQLPAVAAPPRRAIDTGTGGAEAGRPATSRADDSLLAVDPADMTLAQALVLPLYGSPDSWGNNGGKPLGELPRSLLAEALPWFRKKLEAPDDRMTPERIRKFEAMCAALPLVIEELDRNQGKLDLGGAQPSPAPGAPASTTASPSAASTPSPAAATPSSPASSTSAPSSTPSRTTASPSSQPDPALAKASKSLGTVLEQLQMVLKAEAMPAPALAYFRRTADRWAGNITAAKRGLSLATLALRIGEKLDHPTVRGSNVATEILDQMVDPQFYLKAETAQGCLTYLDTIISPQQKAANG